MQCSAMYYKSGLWWWWWCYVVCGSSASILAQADPHVSQLSVTFHSSMEFHWRLAERWEGGRGEGGEYSAVLAWLDTDRKR